MEIIDVVIVVEGLCGERTATTLSEDGSKDLFSSSGKGLSALINAVRFPRNICQANRRSRAS